MAMETRFPVGKAQRAHKSVYAFVATEVKPARDSEQSTREKFVQQGSKGRSADLDL